MLKLIDIHVLGSIEPRGLVPSETLLSVSISWLSLAPGPPSTLCSPGWGLRCQPGGTPGVRRRAYVAVLFLNHRLSHGQARLEIGLPPRRTGRALPTPPALYGLPAQLMSSRHALCSSRSQLLPISKQTCTFIPCLWTCCSVFQEYPLPSYSFFKILSRARIPGHSVMSCLGRRRPLSPCPCAGLCHVTVAPSGPPRAQALPAQFPSGVCNVLCIQDASVGRVWRWSPVPFRSPDPLPVLWALTCL